MDSERWLAVDRYIADALSPHDSALESALAESAKAGLPEIQVAATQGKLLHVLALAIGAQRILEIGTLGGYSTIWLARALPPSGELISLEVNSKHAEISRRNIERAGLGDRVEVRLGRALDSLADLHGPFDLVFIDADKSNIPSYFEACIQLTRPRGLIIVDNVVRGGQLIEHTSEDPDVRGVQRLHEMLRDDRRVAATSIQTVSSKGYDGFLIATVR